MISIKTYTFIFLILYSCFSDILCCYLLELPWTEYVPETNSSQVDMCIISYNKGMDWSISQWRLIQSKLNTRKMDRELKVTGLIFPHDPQSAVWSIKIWGLHCMLNMSIKSLKKVLCFYFNDVEAELQMAKYFNQQHT